MTYSVTKLVKFLVIATSVTAISIAALFVADFVTTNHVAQDLVGNFGYVGILVLAIFAGVNVLLPVPAATFVPIFTAAGFWLPLIVLMLVIGTTIADFVGYFIGRWSKEFAEEHYPKTYRNVLTLKESHHQYLLPVVFLYAAMIPFPNEAMIIPLAIVGIKFRSILLPLLLGNALNQTALALGASNIFILLF